MDRKFVSLMIIFFLSFGIFVSIVFFEKPLTQMTRASQELTPSSDNSLVFAWPLTSKADSQSNVIVSVFIRNEKGIPLSNKKVHLNSSIGNIKENDIATNKEGKSTFHLTSNTAGTAEVSAIIDSTINMSKKVTIKFE